MNFFKTIDDAQIFYRDLGEGSPVILIHGWPLNADMWEYQVLNLLRKGFRVITYDRRGFGRSDQVASGYDYNCFSDDLHSLIEHLGLTKISLVGFSMGGGEIARYLGRYGSDHVASAVLISSVTPYMLKDASNPAGVKESIFSKIIAEIEEDRPHFLAKFTKQFYGENIAHHPVSQETKDWTCSMAMQASLQATIECVLSFGSTDFRNDMAAFQVPTLIIHGDADQTVPMPVTGSVAAKMVATAQFKIYKGAPHGVFITHKEKLNEDLFEFLNQNRAPEHSQEFVAQNKKIGFDRGDSTRIRQ